MRGVAVSNVISLTREGQRAWETERFRETRKKNDSSFWENFYASAGKYCWTWGGRYCTSFATRFYTSHALLPSLFPSSLSLLSLPSLQGACYLEGVKLRRRELQRVCSVYTFSHSIIHRGKKVGKLLIAWTCSSISQKANRSGRKSCQKTIGVIYMSNKISITFRKNSRSRKENRKGSPKLSHFESFLSIYTIWKEISFRRITKNSTMMCRPLLRHRTTIRRRSTSTKLILFRLEGQSCPRK